MPNGAQFFEINAGGTARLLESLSSSALPARALLISTVAVYGRDGGEMLDENTPLAATDPYGQSKVQAERLFCGWADRPRASSGRSSGCRSSGAKTRPGNLGAMITAMRAGRYFGVGSGKARKSIVWGMDVGRILLRAAREGGVYHLTDGHHPMFCEIERAVAARLGLRPPRRLPYPVAWGAAMAGTLAGALLRRPVPLDVRRFRKMTLPLTFDDHRARLRLGWSPCPVVEMIKVPHAPTRSTKSYKGS